MQFLVLLLCATLSISALELSVQSGKEASQSYSLLHLRNTERFLCQEKRDDMDVTTSVVCAFKKRPPTPIQQIENDFFSIRSTLKENTFFIIVTPFKKIALYPQYFNLLDENETFQVKDDYAKHWIIMGYEKNPPLLKTFDKNKLSINFPIPHMETAHPFIGGLDMLGNPIKMTRIKDVSEYLNIKKHYESGRYDMALGLIDEVLKEYPDTIFKSELMLYRIRSYHKKGEAEPLIETAKQFMREYSSDLNMAEVLADTANAYANIGLFTDADYFFDRLFDEHKESPFSHLGYVYKAQQLESSGNAVKAMEYYERALRQATDRDTASLAAERMVLLLLEQGKTKRAEMYARKILQGNPAYFVGKSEASIELALDFASRSYFKIAADIATVLLDAMDRSNENYETLLKNRGYWLAETAYKEDALDAFNAYLDAYKYGMYADEIKKEKDALFFDVNDENSSARLERYDLLMNKYAGDSIAERALYEKAKLLLAEQRYREVLELEERLSHVDPTLYDDVPSIIVQAAIGEIETSLRANACENVVNLSQYHDINLSREWDGKLFECFITAGDFEAAKHIALGHLKSKNYNERSAWLERYIRIDFALGNYTAVIDAAKELIALRDDVASKGDIYRTLFDAAQRLGEKETMLDAITQIETVSGLNFDDVERYTQMVTLAKDSSDDVMLESFAKKVMTLQERTQSFTQSPYIEFTLAQALQTNGKLAQALEVVKSLDKRDLNPSKRSRQKYLLGTLYQKNGAIDSSRKAYEACMEADSNGSWAKLASDALKLLP